LLNCKGTFSERRVPKRIRLLRLVEKRYVRLRKKVGWELGVGKGNHETSLVELYNEKLEWVIKFNFGRLHG